MEMKMTRHPFCVLTQYITNRVGALSPAMPLAGTGATVLYASTCKSAITCLRLLVLSPKALAFHGPAEQRAAGLAHEIQAGVPAWESG